MLSPSSLALHLSWLDTLVDIFSSFFPWVPVKIQKQQKTSRHDPFDGAEQTASSKTQACCQLNKSRMNQSCLVCLSSSFLESLGMRWHGHHFMVLCREKQHWFEIIPMASSFLSLLLLFDCLVGVHFLNETRITLYMENCISLRQSSV